MNAKSTEKNSKQNECNNTFRGTVYYRLVVFAVFFPPDNTDCWFRRGRTILKSCKNRFLAFNS